MVRYTDRVVRWMSYRGQSGEIWGKSGEMDE